MVKSLKILAYPFGGFSTGVYAAFSNSLLPLFLILYTQNTALIGLLVTISTFESALGPLFIGPMTDHISSPIGRRKIFILAGSVLTAFFLVAIPFATTFSMIVILIILAGLARSIRTAPLFAMLTQNSTHQNRGKVSALLTIFDLLGQVVLSLVAFIYWKDTLPMFAFFIIALLFFMPNLLVLFYSIDNKRPLEEGSTFRLTNLTSFFNDKSRNMYIASQFSLWFGISSVLPFFTLFIREYIALPQQEAIFLYFILIAASGLCAYPFAMLGKHIGELRAFRIGLVAFAIASLCGMFAKQLPLPTLYLIAVLGGFGFAATAVYTFTLLSRIVEEKAIGLASGIHAFITAGFAPIAASLSGYAIGIFGYPSMFVILAATTILSLLMLNTLIRRKIFERSLASTT